MALSLNRKIDFAIKLLQSIPQDGPIEMSKQRTKIIRYMEPGETMEFPYVDQKDWISWRSSVVYLNKLFNVWFRCRKKGDKILITRNY